MEIQPKLPASPAEFLHWRGGGDSRWELVRGAPVKLPRDGTRDHMRTMMYIAGQLCSGLSKADYGIATSVFAVLTPDGVRMPDIVVDVMEGSGGTDLCARAPILIAEITSPWSAERDFGEKLVDYQAIASLCHYLVLTPDENAAWLWSRPRSGVWKGPTIHGSAPLFLDALGISVCTRPLWRSVDVLS